MTSSVEGRDQAEAARAAGRPARRGVPARPGPPGPGRRAALLLAAHPYAVTVVLLGLLVLTGVSGADWPAQQFRAELAREHGALLWNNQWYDGHLLPGYSVLTPLLAGAVGTAPLTAVACVVAVWAWARLGIGRTPLARGVGSLWFAVAVSIEYLIGRTPFALGVALGLLALLAARSNKPVLTGVAALATGLTSPLPAAFLLMTALAWVPAERVWRTRAAFLPALAGLVLPLAFPGGGDFSFPAWRMLAVVGFCGLGLWLLPRDWATGRRFVFLYGASALVFFVVPSAVGGNVARLGEMVGGPLAAAALLSLGRKKLLALLTVPLLGWQFSSAAIAVHHHFGDRPAKEAGYYSGLLEFLRTHNTGPATGRVEVPFTRGHREALFVAREQPLARGWERQLDRKVNSALYQPDLDTNSYSAWAREKSVRYIALPDVPLDPAGYREAELLKAGADWLKPVWSDEHWKVWEVVDPVPLVDGPGRFTSMDPSSFTVTADAPGVLTVRVHASRWFTSDRPGTVLGRTEEGWTTVTVTQPGPVTVKAEVFP